MPGMEEGRLMASDDVPLTRRELARLLRVFAALLERSNMPANDTGVIRSPSKKARPGSVPPSDVTRARARAVLRRMGVLP